MSSTNSTIVGWQGGGDTRGTWDIVKICLVTIFACTWSILRRPVPNAKVGGLKTLADKLTWTGIAILLPEVILSEAISTWSTATDALRDYSGYYAVATNDPSADEIAHPSVPFRISNLVLWLAYPFDRLARETVASRASKPKAGKVEGKDANIEDEEGDDEAMSTDLTIVHAYMLLDKGIVFHPASNPRYLVSLPDGDAARTVTQLWRYVRVPLADIEDKSKADIFARLTAVVQLLTLVLSSITRWAAHTTVSPLEVATIFFALQALLVYLVNWKRPQGVGSPLRVELSDPAFASLERNLEVNDKDRDESRMRRLLPRQHIPGESIPNMNTRFENASYQGAMISITNLIFGAVHFAEWNYPFPTIYETWLWRAGAIATVSLPALAYVGWRLMVDIIDTRDEYSPKFRPLGRWQFPAALMVLYASARLLIIGVAFSSLRQAPADLYGADWSQNVPAVN